jgi:hypothetical protein
MVDFSANFGQMGLNLLDWGVLGEERVLAVLRLDLVELGE